MRRTQPVPIFHRACRIGVVALCVLSGTACTDQGSQTQATQASATETQSNSTPAMPGVAADGTVQVAAFTLPESAFLSQETRAALKEAREIYGPDVQRRSQACKPMQGADNAELPAIRQCYADAFQGSAAYKYLRDRYPVVITAEEIGGVPTEIFVPAEGVARRNEQRVLIDLHGGGFTGGSRTSSHSESIPIAAVGKIKVIAVDYRLAPEHTFPAGSEDVAAVYRELLKRYKPENIGLYGCSVGGQLVAHAIAWFQRENLPRPGAVGLFCAGAPMVVDGNKTAWVRSDTAYFAGAISGANFEHFDRLPYYRGVDRNNPLASPGNYDDVMAKFPPTLLISGTRDSSLSGVLVTHAQLVRLGVKADLHAWEGMGHAFFYNPALPESREAYDVITKFFDTHLGT